MLVFGASGFAKNVLEILVKNDYKGDICFFDNVTLELGDLLYDRYRIIKCFEEVEELFNKDNRFTIGIGDPILRRKFHDILVNMGGKFVSTISNLSCIGSFNVVIQEGVNISFGAIINNDTVIKKGVLININATIGHDCTIGEFVEVCPNVSVSGNCIIENNVFIGSNATIAPRVKIGRNCIIGANSLVLDDIPPNSFACGTPAKIVKSI